MCGALSPVLEGAVKPEPDRPPSGSRTQADRGRSTTLPRACSRKRPTPCRASASSPPCSGIVITMGAIDGPPEQIGEKVGAALVGTFLGILLSYGFLSPLAVKLESLG